MYKLAKDFISSKEIGIIRLSDNAFIPLSDDNTDYQAYLAWVAEGNVAEPADQQGEQV